MDNAYIFAINGFAKESNQKSGCYGFLPVRFELEKVSS